ncbi:MAG: (Fe-S)-binding protein [Desulfovermiculus sp.]|nr:(Fe-S)-binding protein [Desulfovermiculus sp.]
MPPKYGQDHTFEAIFVLGLIGGLMVFEGLFEAAHVAAADMSHMPAPLSLGWFFSLLLSPAPTGFLLEVPVVSSKTPARTLYFVDSATSYDERLQDLARGTSRILSACGEEFGILGKGEKDSGHEVRRFGEEMLFQSLKEHNTQAILDSGVETIVTADPHALNALTKDYQGLPRVEHIAEYILGQVQAGKLTLSPLEDQSAVYTYHDPCYLGRHNLLYDPPREVLDAIPGLTRVEMERCRDRSFCCGGGGLMLFYEPLEDQRMGQVRVKMAEEAGATAIVTGCPFCLVNLEDGVKTSGLEGKIEVMDLTELVARQIGGTEDRGPRTEDR